MTTGVELEKMTELEMDRGNTEPEEWVTLSGRGVGILVVISR
jgi:hypothetical protein